MTSFKPAPSRAASTADIVSVEKDALTAGSAPNMPPPVTRASAVKTAAKASRPLAATS